MRIRTMAAAGIAGALGLALAAQAQEVPKQRVGLWRSDMVMAGQSISAKSCVDAASAARMSIFSSSIRRSDKCQQLQLSHNPDGSWTSVSRCEIRPGAPETSRADVSGDFNSRIVMTLRTPPTAAPVMTATMTWIGPCGPGMRGGDVMMADGTKVNVDPAP